MGDRVHYKSKWLACPQGWVMGWVGGCAGKKVDLRFVQPHLGCVPGSHKGLFAGSWSPTGCWETVPRATESACMKMNELQSLIGNPEGKLFVQQGS